MSLTAWPLRRWLAALLILAAPAALAEARPLAPGAQVEVAFSPWDDPEALILQTLAAARKTIRVQAYAFTSRSIAQALVEARERGVDVAVLADAEMNRRAEGNAIARLLQGGVAVAFETRYNAAHNKVILVDPDSKDCAVITGSYNFTWSARARNAENLLILRGDPKLVRDYLDNWQRHRAEATPIHRLPFAPAP